MKFRSQRPSQWWDGHTPHACCPATKASQLGPRLSHTNAVPARPQVSKLACDDANFLKWTARCPFQPRPIQSFQVSCYPSILWWTASTDAPWEWRGPRTVEDPRSPSKPDVAKKRYRNHPHRIFYAFTCKISSLWKSTALAFSNLDFWITHSHYRVLTSRSNSNQASPVLRCLNN